MSLSKRERKVKPHINNKLSSPEFTHLVEAPGGSRKEDLLLHGPGPLFYHLRMSIIIFVQALGLLFCPRYLEGGGVLSTVGE